MKKSMFLSLLMILVLILGACAAPAVPAPPEEPPVETPPVTSPGEDRSYTNPPFAFPILGGYHEDLALEQEALRAKGLLFGILIDNEADWKAAIEKYGFESAREGQTLEYDSEYFENFALLLVFTDQGSSSILYQFGKAEATDTLIDVTLEQYMPEMMTTDIVMKGFVAGLDKKNLYLADGSLKPLNITQRTIPVVYDTPRDELTVDDLRLGNLAVYLAALELDFRMARQPVSVDLKQDGYEQWRYYDDVTVLIIENEVFMISTESPDYPTPRGLKAGDSVDMLTELYGEASLVETLDNGNELYSFDLSGEYHLFHAEIKDNVILRLQVNLTM
jgi:hypothetical protein